MSLVLSLAFGALVPAAAQATFPGTNGAIVYTMPEGGPPTPRHIASVYVGATGHPIADPVDFPATPVDLDGEAFDPSWSPDGRSLAFASTRSGHRQIYMVQLDFARRLLSPCAVQPCRLTNDSAEDYDPAWSPDEGHLVFTSTLSGTPQIYRMNASGGEVTRLTFDDATDQQASFSEAGQIVFTSDRTGVAQLYTMNINGGEVRQITSMSTPVTDPSWSPDGTEIAFASGGVGSYQVYVVALSGGSPVPLTKLERGTDNKLPQWSPDGTKLIITHGPALSGDTHLEEIDAKTGQLLSVYIAEGGDPNWAPLPVVPSSHTPGAAASAAVPGASAVARQLSGSVTVTPGHNEAAAESSSPLSGQVSIPVNSTYDTTHGVVALAVARTTSVTRTATSTAEVSGGTFSLSQGGPAAVPIIHLIASPSRCFASGAVAARSRRGYARVRVRSEGPFIGAGPGYGHGSVRGDPRWEIIATCEGTVYRSISGVVIVTDPHRRHKIRLTAGHSYLVRSSPE